MPAFCWFNFENIFMFHGAQLLLSIVASHSSTSTILLNGDKVIATHKIIVQ
jgi:hypothetical protein